MRASVVDEDLSDLRPSGKIEDNQDKITKFDFIDYQRTKDVYIRNKIAEHYIQFSKKVSDWLYFKTHFKNINDIFNCFIDFSIEDFEQYGFFGLLNAIDDYNPYHESNACFETYAKSRIIGNIKDELRKPLFFSGPLRRKGNSIPLMFSLDRGVGECEDEEYNFFNSKILKDKRILTPLEEIIKTDTISSFLNNGFSKRDYQIFVDYELGGYTFREAAERSKVSEGRAHQIHAAIMKEVKEETKRRNLDIINFLD